MDVTLQINFAPLDVLHARHLLPHQLRTFSHQVSEVLFTLDTVRPTSGRFAQNWHENEAAMLEFLSQLVSTHPHARVGAVNVADDAVAQVGQRFFGVDRIPMKDSRGGPLYSYLYGLHDARCDLVLHIDSDMLFGGGAQTWVAEAVQILCDQEDVLFVGPLPGPPRADGRLFEQPYAVAESERSHMFRFPTMSTRVFLTDRRKLGVAGRPLELAPPLLWRSRVKARIKGNPSVAMPEQIFSRALRERGLFRIDFLGTEPGLWSLHPAYRSETFYAGLPELVRRVESGDIPEAQRGHYDIVDELLDFSDVRAKLRRSPLRR